MWRIRNLTLQPARLRALRPGRPPRQLTVDGTLDHTGDVHLPLLLQVQLENRRETSPTHPGTAQPTPSVTARLHLELSTPQFPEAFVLARRLYGAASGQKSWNVAAAEDATLTQCVFGIEPDDEAGCEVKELRGRISRSPPATITGSRGTS